MFSRFSISAGLALFVALAFVLPALAGGWAVITLDELPTGVVAGEPLTIGFTVRQHGRTPMDGLYPTVTASLSEADRLVVDAKADGKPGHYTATFTFPKEGEWSWSIQAFTMDQRMPALRVAAPAAAGQPVVKDEPSARLPSLLGILGALGLGAGMAGLILAYRRRSRLALVLAVLVVSAGFASFKLGAAVPAAEAQSKAKPSTGSSPSQVEMGRQLFLAKGCITCHFNDRAAARADYWTIEMGAPDLTRYSSSPEVLSVRLKDPAAARSDTKMPNLELREAEIEALIAFINAK